MGRTFAGGWLNKQFQVTPPELLHTVDPSHATPTPGDPTVGAYGAPAILGTDPAPYVADQVTVYEEVPWVVNTSGGPLDMTPEGHDQGNVLKNFTEGFTAPGGAAPGDVDYARASAVAHGTDYGASRERNYEVPPFQASDERYEGFRIEGMGPVGDLIPTLAGGGQRGLNGLSVNNPGLPMYDGRGYRYGWTEWNRVDRKMYDPTRVHDERLNLPNVADLEANNPVPAGAGAYNSPFASMARAITDIQQKPLMRRQPPPVEQSIMTDGEPSYDPYYSDSWVVG